MSITVYIDMDGVVCDWHKAIGNKSFDKEWFHQFIDNEGFKKLEPLGDITSLKRFIKNFENNVSFLFLSSCGGVEQNYAEKVKEQKRNWLDSNGFYHCDLLCVAHKGLKKRFATPNSILIDDTLKNVEDFIEHKGYAIKTDTSVGIQEEHLQQLASHFIDIEMMYEDAYYTE